MEEKRYIIDRFEEGVAVCENEDGTHEEFDARLMPEGAGEGSCIVLREGVFYADAAETQRRRERMLALLRRAQNR